MQILSEAAGEVEVSEWMDDLTYDPLVLLNDILFTLHKASTSFTMSAILAQLSAQDASLLSRIGAVSRAQTSPFPLQRS